MTISVHCFGRVAETVGDSVIDVAVPDACTVAELAGLLADRYPGLADTTFKIAVDRRIADEPEAVPAGAEIAVLPPFAGG